MNDNPSSAPAEPDFGVHFNRHYRWPATSPPSWAHKFQRQKWEQAGMVLWEEKTQTITHLTATQAVQILDDLLENQAWQHQTIEIGEPGVRLSIAEPDRPPEPALANIICLPPARTQQLLDTLQHHKSALVEMRTAEEEHRRRALGKAYALLIELGRKKRQRAAERPTADPDAA